MQQFVFKEGTLIFTNQKTLRLTLAQDHQCFVSLAFIRAAPLGNAVKDLDTGKHRVVERSRTRQSLDLPRRSPNSGEFGYKKSFTALPNGAVLKFRATPLGLRVCAVCASS